MAEICFISLGNDCSVSYQLRKLGLQKYGTMPFDWMKIENLKNVIAILENEFKNIANFECYEVKKQSLEAFNYFISNKESQESQESQVIKSQKKLVHKEYKFILPHEYKNESINIMEFQDKYSRRIKRFLEIGRNQDIKKIFVRCGNKKEIILESSLQCILDKLGIVHYEIKFIILEEWEKFIPKDKPFSWHRDYIPWHDLLIH